MLKSGWLWLLCHGVLTILVGTQKAVREKEFQIKVNRNITKRGEDSKRNVSPAKHPRCWSLQESHLTANRYADFVACWCARVSHFALLLDIKLSKEVI